MSAVLDYTGGGKEYHAFRAAVREVIAEEQQERADKAAAYKKGAYEEYRSGQNAMAAAQRTLDEALARDEELDYAKAIFKLDWDKGLLQTDYGLTLAEKDRVDELLAYVRSLGWAARRFGYVIQAVRP